MRTDRIIGLAGIGIFICLTLQGLSFLFSKILEEVLIFTKLDPLWICGISEYVTLILILLSFIWIIKKLKLLDFQDVQILKRTFFVSIFSYFFTQVLGFAQPFVSGLYESMEYFNLKENYYSNLRENYFIRQFAIDTPTWILKYLIIAIIILKEMKTVYNNK